MLRRSTLCTMLVFFQMVGCTSSQFTENDKKPVGDLKHLQQVRGLGEITAFSSKSSGMPSKKANSRGIASVESGIQARTDWPEGFEPRIVTDPTHLANLKLRAKVKEMQAKMVPVLETANQNEKTPLDFTNNALTKKARPGSFKAMAGKKNNADSNFSASAMVPHTASVKAASTTGERFLANSVNFGPSDYTNSLNKLYTTLYASNSATSVRVQFDYLDLEPGYDKVKLYDAYGLCAEYTGEQNDFTSATCQGNFVDVYVYTDATTAGSSYDGFYISGLYEDYEDENEAPYVYGYANTYSPLTNQSVRFDSTAYDYDGYITSYYWEFGDGYTSSGSSVSHSYSRPGTYYVYVTVYDNRGGWAWDSFSVTVTQAPPDASFNLRAPTIAISSPAVIYPSATDAKSVQIDWGDNATTTLNPYSTSYGTTGISHSYTSPGNYLIVLRATNSGGTRTAYKTVTVQGEEIPPTLFLSNSAAITTRQGKYYNNIPKIYMTDDGVIYGLGINWGGGSGLIGSTEYYSPISKIPKIIGYQGAYSFSRDYYYYQALSNNKKRTVAGAYNTTVSAIDNMGNVKNLSYTFISKNAPPTITNKMTKACASLQCQFAMTPVATLLADPDGTVSSYQWDFMSADKKSFVPGCPTVFNTEAVSCVFPQTGNYNVRFRVTDNLGLYKDLFVAVKATNAAPVISSKIVKSCQSLDCQFSYDTSKTPITSLIKDNDGTITNYGWSVFAANKTTPVPGCNPAQNTTSFNCLFPASGTYYLRVQATDNYNLTSTLWVKLAIKNLAPTVAKLVKQTCTSLSCQYVYDLSKTTMEKAIADKDGSIAQYGWVAYMKDKVTPVPGCPAVANVTSFSCVYPAVGTYYVRFYATDNYGLTTDVIQTVAAKNAIPVIKGTIAHTCTGRSCNVSIGAGKPVESVIYDTDGTIASYKWEFVRRDGVAACPAVMNSLNGSCTFSAAGTYTVRLTATDNYGLSKVVTKAVTVK